MTLQQTSRRDVLKGAAMLTAIADHALWQQEQHFLASIRHLDDTEVRILLDAVRAGQGSEGTFLAAMQQAKDAIAAHRARAVI